METTRIPRQLPPPAEATRPRSAAPPPPSWGDTPLFASLAEQWRAGGRTVPGMPDTEWNDLTRRPPGRRFDAPPAEG
ncbi:hypothetical protein LO771_23035 [Streptacidiphilus sp. ASG 303]|uniref:hypothetical protein n=1 Tax=Streptacidiphilus sp. ASG 303 TaxID=2896847 RepID=UPI001E5CFE28|nr:hypothetical protein [Streptacidiphilus sp. ASG 303]MCD0485178.1 hypothetical protein [Streptacidiphilus sp. ASG 303]